MARCTRTACAVLLVLAVAAGCSSDKSTAKSGGSKGKGASTTLVAKSSSGVTSSENTDSASNSAPKASKAFCDDVKLLGQLSLDTTDLATVQSSVAKYPAALRAVKAAAPADIAAKIEVVVESFVKMNTAVSQVSDLNAAKTALNNITNDPATKAAAKVFSDYARAQCKPTN